VLVKLAKCCTPVPPDRIVGFVTRGNGLSVHRSDCPNVTSLRKEPERFIDVAWAEGADAVYLVQVQVEALDRQGLLSDISRVLSEHGVNLLRGNMTTTKERVAVCSFVFEMADPRHLEQVLRELRKIEGVYDAHRVTGVRGRTSARERS
jgi:GTP pyrophosphokinase